MPGFVPSYGEGTMGELVLQVLRDAGDGGLTVTELIEACDRAGRKFKNAMAAQSGARNALVGQGNPKSQADAKAVFMCLSKEGKFVDQRWTLRFDNLDLTSLPQTPTGETVIVPKRGGKPGGRRKSSEPTEPRATRGAAAAVPAPEPPAETTTTTSARPQRQKSKTLLHDDDFEYDDDDVGGGEDDENSSDDDEEEPALDPTSPATRPKKRRRRGKNVGSNAVPHDERDEKFPDGFEKTVGKGKGATTLGGDVWVCHIPRKDTNGAGVSLKDKSFRLFERVTKRRYPFKDVDPKGFHSSGTNQTVLRSVDAVRRYLQRQEDLRTMDAKTFAAKYPGDGTINEDVVAAAKAEPEPETSKAAAKVGKKASSVEPDPAESQEPPPTRSKSTDTPVDKQLLRRMRWGWPTAEAAAANKVTSGVRGRKKPDRMTAPEGSTSYPFVLIRGAPVGTPAPAVTSPSGWVMCIPGAILSFNDGSLLMLSEFWETSDGVGTVCGRMVLTRPQLRDTYCEEKKLVSKVPGWRDERGTYTHEEEAETRQLFLTETEIERRLDNLRVAVPPVPGACLVRTRVSARQKDKGSEEWHDTCCVLSKTKFDVNWDDAPLEDSGPWRREVFSRGDDPTPRRGVTSVARITHQREVASSAQAALAAVAEKRRAKTEAAPMDVDSEPTEATANEPGGDEIKKEKRRRIDLNDDDDDDEYEPERKVQKKSFVDAVRRGSEQPAEEGLPVAASSKAKETKETKEIPVPAAAPEDARASEVHAQVRAKADEMREVQAAQAKAETEARDRAYAESQARAEKQRKEREERQLKLQRMMEKQKRDKDNAARMSLMGSAVEKQRKEKEEREKQAKAETDRAKRASEDEAEVAAYRRQKEKYAAWPVNPKNGKRSLLMEGASHPVWAPPPAPPPGPPPPAAPPPPPVAPPPSLMHRQGSMGSMAAMGAPRPQQHYPPQGPPQQHYPPHQMPPQQHYPPGPPPPNQVPYGTTPPRQDLNRNRNVRDGPSAPSAVASSSSANSLPKEIDGGLIWVMRDEIIDEAYDKRLIALAADGGIVFENAILSPNTVIFLCAVTKKDDGHQVLLDTFRAVRREGSGSKMYLKEMYRFKALDPTAFKKHMPDGLPNQMKIVPWPMVSRPGKIDTVQRGKNKFLKDKYFEDWLGSGLMEKIRDGKNEFPAVLNKAETEELALGLIREGREQDRRDNEGRASNQGQKGQKKSGR